jgi:hypothetical protein
MNNLMKAYLRDGRVISIPLANSELMELISAVKKDKDGLIEISIDPVADKTENYISPELESTTIGSRLLRLDSDIATLLEGGFRIDSTVVKEISLPSDEIIRLLHPMTGDTAYKAIVERFVSPPTSWHSTVITVGIARDSSYLPIKISTNPTPVFATPDGRRLHPSEGQQAIASKPYMSLLRYFENHPEAFVNTMPYLDAGMRYARAFALMTAFKASQGRVWNPPVSYNEPSDAQVLQELVMWQNSIEKVRLQAKRGKVQKAWRDYRLSIKPDYLSNAQRITFFVDEAFAHYRNLAAAKQLVSISPSDPDTLLRFIEGIDLEKEKYGSWALLAKFMVGVWAGHPLDELIVTMRQAHDHATQNKDAFLLYETLKVTEDLVPVMRSNVYVLEAQGKTLTPIPIPKHLQKYVFIQKQSLSGEITTSSMVGNSVEPNAYLDQLEAYVDDAIREHMIAVYDYLNSKVDSLFTSDEELAVDQKRALKVLEEFEMSHIAEERHRIKHDIAEEDSNQSTIGADFLSNADSLGNAELDSFKFDLLSTLLHGKTRSEPVLLNLGKIHYAIGLAAAKENDRAEVLDRARLLSSYARVAEDEFAYSTANKLKEWSDRLHHIKN